MLAKSEYSWDTLEGHEQQAILEARDEIWSLFKLKREELQELAEKNAQNKDWLKNLLSFLKRDQIAQDEYIERLKSAYLKTAFDNNIFTSKTEEGEKSRVHLIGGKRFVSTTVKDTLIIMIKEEDLMLDHKKGLLRASERREIFDTPAFRKFIIEQHVDGNLDEKRNPRGYNVLAIVIDQDRPDRITRSKFFPKPKNMVKKLLTWAKGSFAPPSVRSLPYSILWAFAIARFCSWTGSSGEQAVFAFWFTLSLNIMHKTYLKIMTRGSDVRRTTKRWILGLAYCYGFVAASGAGFKQFALNSSEGIMRNISIWVVYLLSSLFAAEAEKFPKIRRDHYKNVNEIPYLGVTQAKAEIDAFYSISFILKTLGLVNTKHLSVGPIELSMAKILMLSLYFPMRLFNIHLLKIRKYEEEAAYEQARLQKNFFYRSFRHPLKTMKSACENLLKPFNIFRPPY